MQPARLPHLLAKRTTAAPLTSVDRTHPFVGSASFALRFLVVARLELGV